MKYTIKPLEWKDKVHVSAIADTLLGRYVVTENGPKYVVIFFPPTGLITSLNPNPTLEAAKAAAEADWQARIKEALEPVPSGWISVEERLPELWVPVLVFGIIEIDISYSTHAAWRNDKWSDDEREWEHEGQWKIKKVTHWQPMPEPPKKEQG